MDPVKQYLSEIGRKGGKASRRSLSSSDASNMVRVRELRRAFRKFHSICFWSTAPTFQAGLGDHDWIVQRLRTFGGHEGVRVAEKLCQ